MKSELTPEFLEWFRNLPERVKQTARKIPFVEIEPTPSQCGVQKAEYSHAGLFSPGRYRLASGRNYERFRHYCLVLDRFT